VVLVAGAIAYFSYAAGDAGPTVTFGHGDASRAAADAWLQIPLHAAAAAGFAAAGPTGARWIAWAASFVGTAAIGLWSLVLLMSGLSSLGDYADELDLVVSATLAVLYGATLILSRRLDSPPPSAVPPDPA
jgi:hypothetical protein